MRNRSMFFTVLVLVNVVAWYMLGFSQRNSMAQQSVRAPFANSVEQRGEMIEQLRAIHAELREQNELLRSGQLEVIAKPPSD